MRLTRVAVFLLVVFSSITSILFVSILSPGEPQSWQHCDTRGAIDSRDTREEEWVSAYVATIFGTWQGDRELAYVQCDYHPESYFCTDDKQLQLDAASGKFTCRVLFVPMRYDYDHKSYKKLQCMHMLREERNQQPVHILEVDVDQRVYPDAAHVLLQATPQEDTIFCLRRPVDIYHNKTEKWYVWREGEAALRTHFLNCIGAFVFIPADVVDHMFRHLAFFEHFHTEDVSFTWFFMRMGYTMESIASVEGLYLEKETHRAKPTSLIDAYRNAPWRI